MLTKKQQKILDKLNNVAESSILIQTDSKPEYHWRVNESPENIPSSLAFATDSSNGTFVSGANSLLVWKLLAAEFNSNSTAPTQSAIALGPQKVMWTIVATTATSPIIVTINNTAQIQDAPQTGDQVTIAGCGNNAANGTWFVSNNQVSTSSTWQFALVNSFSTGSTAGGGTATLGLPFCSVTSTHSGANTLFNVRGIRTQTNGNVYMIAPTNINAVTAVNTNHSMMLWTKQDGSDIQNSATGFTVTQAGNTVTASSPVFTANMVNNYIYVGVVRALITAFISATQVTVNVSQTVATPVQGNVIGNPANSLDMGFDQCNDFVFNGGGNGNVAYITQSNSRPVIWQTILPAGPTTVLIDFSVTAPLILGSQEPLTGSAPAATLNQNWNTYCNGIDFTDASESALYVSLTATARILKVPINNPIASTVFVADEKLYGADGIRRDANNDLWVAVNNPGNRMLRIRTGTTPPIVEILTVNGFPAYDGFSAVEFLPSNLAPSNVLGTQKFVAAVFSQANNRSAPQNIQNASFYGQVSVPNPPPNNPTLPISPAPFQGNNSMLFLTVTFSQQKFKKCKKKVKKCKTCGKSRCQCNQ